MLHADASRYAVRCGNQVDIGIMNEQSLDVRCGNQVDIGITNEQSLDVRCDNQVRGEMSDNT